MITTTTTTTRVSWEISRQNVLFVKMYYTRTERCVGSVYAYARSYLFSALHHKYKCWICTPSYMVEGKG